jgi:hypothetical protein
MFEGAYAAPPCLLFSIISGHETPARVVLLMEAEGAVYGCDIGDGMLVDENVPMDFQENGEIVERLDIAFHLVAGHQLHDYLYPLLA